MSFQVTSLTNTTDELTYTDCEEYRIKVSGDPIDAQEFDEVVFAAIVHNTDRTILDIEVKGWLNATTIDIEVQCA